MANDLRVTISAEDNASAVFQKVGDSATTMAKAIEQVGESGAGIQSLTAQVEAMEGELRTVGTAFAVLGGSGIAGLGLATNASMQFTSALANVNSIARLSTAEMQSLESSILAMSAQFSAMPTDLAEGLYDIVGSGFEASDALMILEAATVSAGAGLTSTGTAATAITAVLNAYGKSADEAGDVSDVLFKTVDSGVISFEELAGSLGRVLPVASSLDVSIQELGAAYAELTVQGINASEAETAIAAVLTAALNPTEAMTAAIKDYGYASAEALIQAEGLAGYLDFLAEASGGTSEGMMALVGNVRALQGALALTRNDGEGFASMLTDMETAAQDGAYTLEVFGIQMDNAAGAVRNAQSELAVAAITIGSAFEPLVNIGATAIAEVVGQFNQLPGAAQNAVSTFIAVASASSLALGSIAVMIPRVIEFRNALATLRTSGTVLGTLAGSMGPLSIGLGLAAAGGVLLYQSFRDVGAEARQLDADLASLSETLEQLKLSGETATSARLETTLAELEAIQAVLEASDLQQMNELLGTAFESALDFDTSAVRDDLQRVVEITDDVTRQITANLNQLNTEQKNAYLDWINDLLASAETTAEDSNLDDILNQILITPASEIPGVMAAASESTLALEASIRSLMGAATAAGVSGFTASLDAMANSSAARADAFEDERRALEELREQADIFAEKYAEISASMAEGFLSLTGDSDFLSQWNMTEYASQASILAERINDVGTSLENMQRVVIGNTNAIGSQMQGLADWADGLIGVTGEYSELDDLLNEGRISLGKYNEAQQAQITIGEANATVQRDLLAIQAAQAPLMAESSQNMADYIQRLRMMNDGINDTADGAQRQLAALGMMDTAMVGQVQQFGEMAQMMGRLGPEGAASMQMLIDGIVATDPVLTAMLVQMGLIEEQANGTYTLNLDAAGAMSEIDALNRTIADLIDMLDDGLLNQSYKANIDLEVSGVEDVENAEQSVQDLITATLHDAVIDVAWRLKGGTEGDGTGGPAYDGPPIEVPSVLIPPDVGPLLADTEPVTVPVDADTGPFMATTRDLGSGIPPVTIPVEFSMSLGAGLAGAADAGLAAAGGLPESFTVTIDAVDNASSVIQSVIDAAAGIPESETITVNIIDNATIGLGYVRSAAEGIPENEQVIVNVFGADLAVGALNNVAAAAAAIPSSVSTTVTTNLVTNRVTNYSTTGRPNRMGGVAGYEAGGVLFEGGEAGYEIAHFVGGGMAALPYHALYEAPRGTYIQPNNAVPPMAAPAPAPIIVNNYGTILGIDDVAGAIEQAMLQRRAGFGGLS